MTFVWKTLILLKISTSEELVPARNHWSRLHFGWTMEPEECTTKQNLQNGEMISAPRSAARPLVMCSGHIRHGAVVCTGGRQLNWAERFQDGQPTNQPGYTSLLKYDPI